MDPLERLVADIINDESDNDPNFNMFRMDNDELSLYGVNEVNF